MWACLPRREPVDTDTLQRSCMHGVVRVSNSGGCGDCVRLNVFVSLDWCFCGGLLAVSCVLAVLFLKVVFVFWDVLGLLGVGVGIVVVAGLLVGVWWRLYLRRRSFCLLRTSAVMTRCMADAL